MSLLAFRDTVSGKFVFHKNYTCILDDLNSDPFDIGGLFLFQENDTEVWKNNPSHLQLEYLLKTKLDMVKIKIIRHEKGKTKEYTETFPPLYEYPYNCEQTYVEFNSSNNIFEMYEII